MDPQSLIPRPDAIPVAAGWFQFLLMLTFTLHILFMNVMLGSTCIAWVDEVNNVGGEAPLGRLLSGKLTYVIALTINLGVAPLLFIQVLYGQFIYVSSILMAWVWLAVIVLLIFAYYWAYLYKYCYDLNGGDRPQLVGFSLLLFLIVAFIFVNNMTLMLRPETWSRYFAQPTGILLNLADPVLWPRYLHFLTASLAVGGLGLALLATIKGGPAAQVTLGLRWFQRATLVQFGIGIWFFWQLPAAAQQLFLAGLHWPAFCLDIGILVALLALLTAWRGLVWPTTILTLLALCCMIIVRDLVRRALLAPYFTISDLQVQPQYSVFYLFLATLIIGLVIIGVMLKWAAEAGEEVQS